MQGRPGRIRAALLKYPVSKAFGSAACLVSLVRKANMIYMLRVREGSECSEARWDHSMRHVTGQTTMTTAWDTAWDM